MTVLSDIAVQRVVPGRRVALVLLAGLGAVLLLVAIYGRVMGFGLRRDEMMFVPPAVLLDHARLYNDFFFNQPPYSAWYYRALHLLFGGAGLFYVARLGVFLTWLALIAATAGTVWALSRSALLALFATLGLVTCHALMDTPGMAATNNLLQIPFAVLGLGLFLIATMGARVRVPLLVLAGLMGGIAVGIKLSAVAIVPPVLVGALLLPAGLPLAERARRVLLPVLLGGVIGTLPLIWYLVTEPQLFLAHVLKFHLGPHVAYWQANMQSEPDLAFGLGARLRLAYSLWFGGVPLITAVVVLAMALRSASGESLRPLWVLLGALAVTAAMSLLPKPGFPQYYILPLACLPLIAALLYRRLDTEARDGLRPFLAAGAALMGVVALPWLAPGLISAARPQATVPAKVAHGAAELRRAIETAQPAGDKVATLLPIYAVQAGLPVYPEFATGQFAYRIAPYTAPDLARNYRMVGAGGVAALFDADPPAAILVGYEPALEEPFIRYAEAHGYRRVEVAGLGNRYGTGIVFLNPGRAKR